jgi:hypothetical protein
MKRDEKTYICPECGTDLDVGPETPEKKLKDLARKQKQG